MGWTNTTNNPLGSQDQSPNTLSLTPSVPSFSHLVHSHLGIGILCSATILDYSSVTIAPYLAATTCLVLVEAVPKRSNCHRRPCNYCAAILGVGLDDAVTHVSFVLSLSIIQSMDDGQHRCNALILDRALLPPGDAARGPWSELAFAISTESRRFVIAINKKLGSVVHGSCESGDVFLLPRCLCRQLNMEPTLSTTSRYPIQSLMQASCRGFSGTGIAPLLARSALFQLWEKRPGGVPHNNSNENSASRSIFNDHIYLTVVLAILILIMRIRYT